MEVCFHWDLQRTQHNCGFCSLDACFCFSSFCLSSFSVVDLFSKSFIPGSFGTFHCFLSIEIIFFFLTY